MRAFQFPLRRMLEWRRSQLDLEVTKLGQMAATLQELSLAAVKLELVKGRAEQNVRAAATVDAGDLWALAAYRARLIAEQQALARRKRECEQRMAEQRGRILEAQRQCRLLEKLEERRRREWQMAADREVESLAAESYLALWGRPSG